MPWKFRKPNRISHQRRPLLAFVSCLAFIAPAIAAEVNVDKVLKSLGPMSGKPQASSLLQEALTSDDSSAAALGHWTGLRDGTSYELILGADQKYVLKIRKRDQHAQETGSYEIKSASLTLRSDAGGVTQAQWQVQGTRMSLTLAGKTLELARADAQTQPAPPAPTGSGRGDGGRSLLDLNLPAPEAPPTQGGTGGGGQTPNPSQVPAPVIPVNTGNPFVGGWVGVIKQAVTVSLVFVEDGRYAIQLATAQESQENQGTYRFDGRVLYTLAQGNAQEAGFPYQFASADSMVLVIEGEQVLMTRQQHQQQQATNGGGAPQTQTPGQPQQKQQIPRPTNSPGTIDPAMVGTWTHTERYSSGGGFEDGPTFVFVLAGDGSYIFSTMIALQRKSEKDIEQGYWSTKDQILYFYNGAWNPTAKYTVNAQGLVLGEGKEKKFFEKKQ